MRRSPLLRILRFALLALPVLEIVGIIWVGHQIGAGWTLLLLLVGIVAGILLIQRAGQRSLRVIASTVRQGQLPTENLAQSGWMVAGGVLFVIPGFITDVLGAFVIVPTTRRLLGRVLRHVVPGNALWVPPSAPTQGDDAEPTVVRGDVL